MAEDHGKWLSTATALMFAWSLMLFAVRVWAKMRTKNWGLDDICLSSALLLSTVHASLYWRAINQGYGRPSEDVSFRNLTEIQQELYASHLLYVILTGLCRVSAALFVSQIAHRGPQTKPAHIIAYLAIAWIVASTFAIAIRGDLREPWATMDGSSDIYARWIGIDCCGLLIDMILWVLSISLVWGLQMILRKRIFILTAFAVRLLLVPIVVFRLLYLKPARNDDLNISSIVPNIFTVIVAHFSIMACCVTSLKPFLHTFNQPTYEYKASGTMRSGRSDHDSYYKLETWKKVERGGGSASASGSGHHPGNWRPHLDSGTGHATAYPTKANTKGERPLKGIRRNTKEEVRDDADSADTDASERMIIQRTTEVSVQYEDENHRPIT